MSTETERLERDEIVKLKERLTAAKQRNYSGAQFPCSWGQLERLLSRLEKAEAALTKIRDQAHPYDIHNLSSECSGCIAAAALGKEGK